MSHVSISPAILYFGTPVVLITSLNPNQTTNIAPMSSCFWLGQSAMLGQATESQTTQNILRTRQCVLNLPTSSMGAEINALAKTTGSADVSEGKKGRDYIYVEDKWSVAGLSVQDSDLVEPKRVEECPVQMECELVSSQDILGGFVKVLEVKVLKVHVKPELVMEGYKNRIDPDKWRPMIMSFQQFYGLQERKVESRLAEISEELYRL